MTIQSINQNMTASLLLAQTNQARSEVFAQQEDSTVAELRRQKEQSNLDYIDNVKERLDARDIVTNDHVKDSVNLSAERYREKAKELLKALAKISQQEPESPPDVLKDAESSNDFQAITDFVLANINSIRPEDARLRVETEYAEYATGAGNDAVSITDDTVSAVRTGDGSDTVSITANRVYSVQTDADRSTMTHISGPGFGGGFGAQKTYDNNDSLSITARDVKHVSTGGGADAIAIQSRLIDGVDAGTGDDALALSGGLVEYVRAGAGNDSVNIKAVLASNIDGGTGDDVISVDARQGDRPLDVYYRPRMDGALDGAPDGAPDGALTGIGFATLSNADVRGGAGNDTIHIRADRHMSVDGGLGDDQMHLESGTIALKYRNGDGQDRISLGAGVSVLVDLDPSARFTVQESEAGTTLQFQDGGSMTFVGLEKAANLILRNGEGAHVLKQDGRFDRPVSGQAAAPITPFVTVGIDLRA